MPENTFDIVGWIQYAFELFKNIIYAVFNDLVEVLNDFAFFILEQMLGVFDWAIGLVSSSFPDIGDAPNWWAGLSQELLNLAGYIHIDTGLGIVIGALIIRLILNFIPFIG
ncbi:MAG: DUF2523 domain-containing protein [Candidatus Nitronauta litoralis]|uniref:DUF2523 domain-containing protein n=1 Tax=Candidatus Nitronauta litoralis TaxID=2705533 RepID=A0A7T0BXQ2_9BACT|nr:MAG: DUF2523 domain-containing protein [Candidatus Nitronauta litoralis]